MAENKKCFECHFFKPEHSELCSYCCKRHFGAEGNATACEYFVDEEVSNVAKADFINELKNFYTKRVGNHIGLTDMEYIEDEPNEWLVVHFGDAKKRFSVRGDNAQGILIDFVRFIQNFNDYRWEREQ